MSFLSLCNCRWKGAQLTATKNSRQIRCVNNNRSDSVAAFSLRLVSILHEMHIRQLQVAAGVSKQLGFNVMWWENSLVIESPLVSVVTDAPQLWKRNVCLYNLHKIDRQLCVCVICPSNMDKTQLLITQGHQFHLNFFHNASLYRWSHGMCLTFLLCNNIIFFSSIKAHFRALTVS